MFTMLKRLWTEEEGQGMAEYGLILSLVAIAVIVSLGLMKDQLVAVFSNITTALTPQ